MYAVRVAWLVMVLYFVAFGWVLSKTHSSWAQEAQAPAATSAANPAPAAGVPADLAEVVKKQFGPCFELATQRSALTVKYLHPQAGPPWVMFLTGDLDGDGVEDAVIVARCKTPLADQLAFHYKVTDPYFTYYGYGDPKITSQFGIEDPTRANLVLVIHGAGQAAWRAETPKAKFVILNLPFETLALTRYMRRKRDIAAVNLIEVESLTSVIFWDGKKYKWAETSGLEP